jgi:hypothetical protein
MQCEYSNPIPEQNAYTTGLFPFIVGNSITSGTLPKIFRILHSSIGSTAAAAGTGMTPPPLPVTIVVGISNSASKDGDERHTTGEGF